MADLPVFLVHYNAPEWIRSATDSILRSTVDVAVTVVNNSPELVLSVDDRVSVIDAARNGGYSGGANIGLIAGARAGAEFVVIGSHDLHLEPDALEVMLAAAKAHPRAGVLGPMLTTNFVAEPAEGDGDLDYRTMVSGTCLLLRRACIEEIGGFDPLYGSYGEDDDLCARAWNAGWSVGRVQGAVGGGIASVAGDKRRHRYPNLVLLHYRTNGGRAATRMAARHLRAAAAAASSREWSEAWQRLRGAVVGARKVLRARSAGTPDLRASFAQQISSGS